MKEGFQCRLVIGRPHYEQLTEEGKSLYELTPLGMQVTFPVILNEGVTLADCIPAFVESVYVEVNPKYDVKETTIVKSELYKLGKTEEVFNLLVTIQYPKEEKPFHELLVFEQLELTDEIFSFSLIGDQTMFQLNH